MERRITLNADPVRAPGRGRQAGEIWREQLRQAVRDPDRLIDLLELPEELRQAARRASELFGLVVPHAFLARMRIGDANDPLLRQILPIELETARAPDMLSNPKRFPSSGKLSAGRCSVWRRD